MTIGLPKDAKDHDYEDQIAAMLIASGYYLEAKLILKKGSEEVLEFDAIATPVNDYQNRKIVEVKSGGWGVSDLFKLYGQVLYTGNKSSWLIHKNPAGEPKKAAIAEISKKAPVSTIHIDIDSSAECESIPEASDIPKPSRKLLFVISWWTRSADRIAQRRFKDWVKSQNPPSEEVAAAKNYCSAIDESLFKDHPLRRADALYDAYKEFPQLTSMLIKHATESGKDDLKAVRRSVSDQYGRTHIQYIMAMEQRARIAIIKNAYDAILLEKAGQEKPAPWAGTTWDKLYKELLPASFKDGMVALDKFPHADKVPYFLQVFIDVFGGFYFPEEAKDLKEISAATGVPEADIPVVFELLDIFFPIDGSWLHKGNGVHWLKSVPAYLRGAGSFAREDMYGKDWSKNFPQVQYQVSGWHNALYKLLEPTLKIEKK